MRNRTTNIFVRAIMTIVCFHIFTVMYAEVYKPTVGTHQGDTAKKVFILMISARDLKEFKKQVTIAARLKPYGRVQINISTLAEKSFYEIPKQRSPWYEYACYNATPYKFFPDDRIAPFLPAEFVVKNRQLLLAKAKILKDNGMEAAFFGSEPDFLPEAFFDAYPEMRGPRVDHPRRSNNMAFSPCVSVKETQEIYAGMMSELLKHAPEIKSFYFKTNDAGAGICWSDWLYSGSNGPQLCKGETTGEKVQKLMASFKEGAARAGKRIDIYMSEPQGSSNFSKEERKDIQDHLPENCYFMSTTSHEIIRIGSDIDVTYPVKSVPDIYSWLRDIQAIDNGKNQTVFINFRAFYDRGNESIEAEDLLLSLLADQLHNPAADNESLIKRLHEYCTSWTGPALADSLYNALLALHDAFNFRNAFLGNIYGINWNVGGRLINRPLVAAPQRLSKEEESYFLPFVFNVSEKEARMDYTDIQGGRWTTRPDSIEIYVRKIRQVAAQLGMIARAVPRSLLIQKLSTGLNIHASLVRSCGNFYAAQMIRDSNTTRLNGPVHRPGKESTWSGDTDLQKFNAIMRDELDNTAELISILRHDGIQSLCLAKDIAHEDCFLLGPAIMEQLIRKRKIMLNHWTDIQDYLTTPFK